MPVFDRSCSVFALIAIVALIGCESDVVDIRTASFTACDERVEAMDDNADTFLGPTAGEIVASLAGDYFGEGVSADGALDLRVELVPTDNVLSIERDEVVSGSGTLGHPGCYDELLVPLRLRLSWGSGDVALDEYIYVRLDEDGVANVDLDLNPSALAGLVLPAVDHSGATSVTVNLDLTDGTVEGLLGFEERWVVNGHHQAAWSALLSINAARD